jgi:hypothetical protein
MARARVTPLGAVVAGAAAGALGTAAMDALWYRRYQRGGGRDSFAAWEFSEGVATWDDASAPGQAGGRVLTGLLGRDVPDQWARTTQNVVHWATGIGWGVQFGVVAASLRRPSWRLGLVLGPTAWLTSYAALAPTGLYKPIWEYDAPTLAKDLSAHMAFGAVTGLSFGVLSWRPRRAGGPRRARRAAA